MSIHVDSSPAPETVPGSPEPVISQTMAQRLKITTGIWKYCRHVADPMLANHNYKDNKTRGSL